MKILIVSLLRLGDILMAAPTVRALRVQHPRAEIHVWIHRGFEHVKNVIVDVDVWHCLERSAILESFQTDSSHSFFGYDILNEQVKSLNKIGFNAVFNLTNTRLSAVLSGAITARQHVGAFRNSQGKFELEGAAFKNFNLHPSLQMHFMDLIWKGSGFPGPVRRPSDLFGQHIECDLLNDDRFLIQLSTSDVKKAWSMSRWRQVIQSLYEASPNADFTVIGAEFERTEIEPTVTEWRSQGLPVNFIACSLSEAAKLIRQHRHFITLDTATKHLALGSRTQVVELALGSSRPFETGIYLENAIIVQGQVPCAPCDHRSRCSKPTHECGDSVLPAQIVNAVRAPHRAYAFKVTIENEGFQIQATTSHQEIKSTATEVFQ